MSKFDNLKDICKCGRKLEKGENLCPACKDDRESFFKGAGTVLGSVVMFVLSSLFLKGKK
jgi:hypothetical protein